MHGDIELHIVPDRGPRALPVQKAVAGSVIHQQIDLVVDLLGIAVERRPIDVALGAIEQAVRRRPATRRLPA